MRVEIYDLECLSNLFTYTGINYHTEEIYQFVISGWKNDVNKLYEHLNEKQLLQVGFNNENFDYPLLHYILNNKIRFEYMSGQEIAQDIYFKAQSLINSDFNVIPDKQKIHQQLDLFKIWHYDNKDRLTSLKDLEIAMNMDNIEEMPIHHTTWCKEGDEQLVLSYNLNDVLATYKFFLVTLGKTDNPLYKGKNKIDLREKLSKKFKIPCMNYPDVKLGEQLILKLYSQKVNKSTYDLKQSGGTKRDVIRLKECIPHWANFETEEFNEIKQKFESTIISNIKGAFNESVFFHGSKMDYGTGGLHSCCHPGVYVADDYWMILDEDIGSLYPSLAIQLGLYPQHLGKEFLEVYDGDIVSVRLNEKKKPKKERDMVIMEGFKLAANGIYGKSGEEFSFLYDPLYTMRTTIGGQMFLSLWTEKLVKAIPEIKFIQHNTKYPLVL